MTQNDVGRQLSSTRLIIPAPVQTNEERGIMWYEIGIGADPGAASHPNRKTVGRAVMRVMSERQFETVISDPRGDVTIGITLHGDADDLRLDIVINGQATTLSGRTVDAGVTGRKADPKYTSLARRLDLAPHERAVIDEWSRLAPSFGALAQATRESYSCPACALLVGGTSVAAAGCAGLTVALNPAAFGVCAAALGGAGTVVENCGGACADFAESAVHVVAQIVPPLR